MHIFTLYWFSLHIVVVCDFYVSIYKAQQKIILLSFSTAIQFSSAQNPEARNGMSYFCLSFFFGVWRTDGG